MKTLLWLDDIRDPMQDDWLVFSPLPRENLRVVWVKTFFEFTNHIIMNGMPDAICFDHDLGMDVAIKAREKGMSKRKSRELKKLEYTGYDAAKWLTEYCMKYKHTLPKWNVQSANPVGKENINSILNNYLKHVESI